MRTTGMMILLLVTTGWCWAQGAGGAAAPAEEGAGAEGEQKVELMTYEELGGLLGDYRTTPSVQGQMDLALTLNTQVKDRYAELLERIEKGKGEERLQAIELVGFARKAQVTSVLQELVKSGDPEVSRRAVDALGTNGDPKSLETLSGILAGKDSALAGRAAIAMGRIGDVSAMPAMQEELKKTQDVMEKLSLIRGLGLLKDPGAVADLQEQLLGSDNPLIHTAVYDALNLIAGDDGGRIAAQLDEIAELLKQLGGDWQTQLSQAAVTDSLDRVIKAAEKSQSQSSSKGKSRQTSRPGQGQSQGGASGKQSSGGRSPAQSSDVPERTSDNPLGIPGANPGAGVEWGNLPPAVREEVTAALKSDLPERYRRFLEIYYKILAEGK